MDVLIGLSGVMIGALIGWIGSIYTLKKQEFYRAAKEFRDTFTDTIHYFKTFKRPNNTQYPIQEYFVKNMETYEKAIIDFLPYLNRYDQVALEDALDNLKYAYEFEKILDVKEPEKIIRDGDYNRDLYFIFYDGNIDNSNKELNVSWEKGLEIAQININLIVEFGKV